MITRRDGSAKPVQDAPQVAWPRQVVADVTLEPGRYAGDLRIKGEVVVPQDILQPALDRIAGQLTHTRNPKVGFDPVRGTFQITGTYTGLPLWHPDFRIDLKPVIKDGKFGLEVTGFDHPGPHWIVDAYFLKKVARCTTDKGYPAEFDRKARTFWIDANAVVHSWTRLSPWLHLDLSRTPFEVRGDGHGGVVLDMDGPPAQGPRENKARIRLDEYAIKAVFNDAFGEHFHVRSIDMAQGKFRLRGRARSDLLDGITGLFALLALAAGGNPHVGEAGIDATVEIAQDKDRFLLRPDIGGQRGIRQIADALSRRGIPASAREGFVEVAAPALLAKYHVQSLDLTPAGLLIEASVAPAEVAHPPRRP